MLVYILVGAVIVAGLILAYRTLGGTASRPVDPATALRAGLAATAGASAELASLLDEGAPLGAGPAHPRGALIAMRRRLDAATQQLERVDAATLDDEPASAHALLVVAADELAWAVRLCAGSAYGTSQGMQQAADALRAHAAACLRDASALLETSARAEEVERSR